MSDVEDMDVDGPAPNLDDAVAFSARSTETRKGKSKGAANIPVPAEQEDSLPWVEKYRPHSLDDVSGHKDVLSTIQRFVDANRLPHLLLYGPPGTGKTSTVLALARRIYGPKNMRQMVLELNASDDRGIDVVREQIKTFSSTKQIFNAFGPSSANTANGTSASADEKKDNLATYKLIILDEADAMTSAAQMALRRIMERYTPNTRFCILANYTHKLSPALLSRCTRFRFSPLPHDAIRSLVDTVMAKENVQIAPDAVDALVTLSKGDMRRALNVLQACHASTLPMPGAQMNGDGAAGRDDPNNFEARDTITPDTIYDCIASPHPSDIHLIRDTLISTSDVASCLSTLSQIKQARGLALMDVVTSLSEELVQLEVPVQTRVRWCEGLAEVEYRLSGGGNETLQMGAMVGVVREGVELMEKSKR